MGASDHSFVGVGLDQRHLNPKRVVSHRRESLQRDRLGATLQERRLMRCQMCLELLERAWLGSLLRLVGLDEFFQRPKSPGLNGVNDAPQIGETVLDWRSSNGNREVCVDGFGSV